MGTRTKKKGGNKTPDFSKELEKTAKLMITAVNKLIENTNELLSELDKDTKKAKKKNVTKKRTTGKSTGKGKRKTTKGKK